MVLTGTGCPYLYWLYASFNFLKKHIAEIILLLFIYQCLLCFYFDLNGTVILNCLGSQFSEIMEIFGVPPAGQMVLRRNAMREWQIKEQLRRQPISGV